MGVSGAEVNGGDILLGWTFDHSNCKEFLHNVIYEEGSSLNEAWKTKEFLE